MENKNVILSAKNIEVKFKVRGRILTAIRNISLDIYEGETIAIVGESGSGKSVFTKTFTGMLETNGTVSNGSVEFENKDLTQLKTDADWEGIRGKKISTVFQDPMTSLNPVRTIGYQISEVIIKHQGKTKEEAKQIAIQLMERVGIHDAEKRYDDYPFQYSGGMRQRIVIAIALACRPRILICDEPTTALDVTIQAQILQLIKDLQKEYGFTTVYITHDLGVVANVADRVAVMYAGQIVEVGKAEEIFYEPQHPYTWALLSSLPQLGIKGEDLYSITGTPPSLYDQVIGDAFAPRNPYAMKIDFEEEPPMFKVSETHYAKTWLLDPRAPKAEPPKAICGLHERLEKMTGEGGITVANDKEVILSVKDLEVTFGSGKKAFTAVQNVNFDVYKGETFSLVGESGSGKTTIGRAIIRINPATKGEIFFKDKKISGKISKDLDKWVIRNIQMVFQDPAASLNERATVDYIVSEGLYNFHLYKDEEDRKNKVTEAIKSVGLLDEHLTRYPHEFSGGQRQRIGIARAMVMEPELLIADEPISALDVSIRAQVLNLLKEFQRQRDLTIIFIAHDLSVVRFISDRIAVIHKGRIVELAETEELFKNSLHPYTKSLLSAVPMPDPQIEKNKELIVYNPDQHDYSVDKPSFQEIKPGHFIWANEKEMEEYRKIVD